MKFFAAVLPLFFFCFFFSVLPGGKCHGDPEFVSAVQNITVPVGRDVKFSCHVRHLGNYKVAWIHFERSAILTVHTHVITRNPRVQVSHENQRTWHLHLSDVQEADRGRYLCQINTAQAKTQSAYLNVVVAPSIDDSRSSSDVIVREGSDVTLQCHADGSPPPAVKWRREDGRKIASHKTSSAMEVEGSSLDLSRISRLDMGVYLCIASNGVPPSVSKRIHVSVDFPPMVWVPQQLVGAPLGATVTIECWLEAHPTALHYWSRPDGQVLHDPSKYRMESINNAGQMSNRSSFTVTSNGIFDKKTPFLGDGTAPETLINPSSYMTHLKLTVRHLTAKDYGPYRCVAKNPRGETDGTIKIYQTDRTGHLIKTGQGTSRQFGTSSSTASSEEHQTEKQVSVAEESLQLGTKKVSGNAQLDSRKKKQSAHSNASTANGPLLWAWLLCTIILITYS